jgi:hypothetical protein
LANSVAIAGLLADLAGALLLASALVFERARYYAIASRGGTIGGFNPRADMARTKEAAQALAGLALLALGFGGQLLAAAGVSAAGDRPLPYLVAGAAIVAACCAVPWERHRRERKVIAAGLSESAHASAGTWVMYAQALRSLNSGPFQGESIQSWAQARYGRQWCARLRHPPPKAVLLPPLGPG